MGLVISIARFQGWSWSLAWGAGFVFFTFVQCLIWSFAALFYIFAYRRIVIGVAPRSEKASNVTLFLPSASNPNKTSILNLPANNLQIMQFSQAVIEGPISESKLIGPSKSFSNRSQWIKLRDYLVERGMLTWRNLNDPSKGVNITPELSDMCSRYLIDGPHNPGGGQVIDVDSEDVFTSPNKTYQESPMPRRP